MLVPLALSRTQDDKGRVRWTLFGGSEQGPAGRSGGASSPRPSKQVPAGVGEAFLRRLLHAVYGIARSRAGRLAASRISHPAAGEATSSPVERRRRCRRGPSRYLLDQRDSRSRASSICSRSGRSATCRTRCGRLPGRPSCICCPFPAVWSFGVQPYFQQLAEQLPLAMQIPLLHLLPRHEAVHGIRVPQSGWMHEPRADRPGADDPASPLRNTYRRTHRWARIHRTDDELAGRGHEDKLAHVLFSTAGDDIGLYGKPMARNVQLWTIDFRLLLDGREPRRINSRAAATKRARRRAVRLPLSVPGDARRAARSLLASAAGCVSPKRIGRRDACSTMRRSAT